MDTKEFSNKGIKQYVAQISTPTVTTTGTNSSLLSDDERLERLAQQGLFEGSAGSPSSQNRLQLTARSVNQTVSIKASACGVVSNTDGVGFSNLQAKCLLLNTSTSLMDALSFTTVESDNMLATETQSRHFKYDVSSHNESNQSLDRDSQLPEPTQNYSRSRFLSLKRVDESPDSQIVLVSDSFQSTSLDTAAFDNNMAAKNSESKHNDSTRPSSCAYKQRMVSEMLQSDAKCLELRVTLDKDVHLSAAGSECDYPQTGALQNESPSNGDQKKPLPVSNSANFCSERKKQELEQGRRLCDESNDGAILLLNDTINASSSMNMTENYKNVLAKQNDKRVLLTACHRDHQLNEQSVQVSKKPTVKDSSCRTALCIVQPRSKSAEAAVSSVQILHDPMTPGIQLLTVGASDAYSKPNPELVSWKPNRKALRTVQGLQSEAENATTIVRKRHQSSSDATNEDQKLMRAICASDSEGKAKAVPEQTRQLMLVIDWQGGKVEDASELKLSNNHSQESQPFCMPSSDIRVEGLKDTKVTKPYDMLKCRASFEFLNNTSSTISAQEIMTSASQAEALLNPELNNASSEPDRVLSRPQDAESILDPGVVGSAEEIDLMKTEKQLVIEDTTSVSHEIISLPTISLGIGDSETPSTRQLPPVHRHAASSCRIRRSTKEQQRQRKNVKLHHSATAECRVKQQQDRPPTKPSSRSAKASVKMQPSGGHDGSSPRKHQRKASTNKLRYESTKHHGGLLATTVKVIASFKHRDQQQQLKRGDEAPSSAGINSSGKKLAAGRSKRKPGQRKDRDLSAQPTVTKLESIGMRQSNNVFADPEGGLGELPRRSQSAWIPTASVQKAPQMLRRNSKPGPGRDIFATGRKKTQHRTAQHCSVGAYRPSREAFSTTLDDQNVSSSLTNRHKRLTSAPSINREKLRCIQDIVPTVRHSSHARPAVRSTSQSTPTQQHGIKNRLARRCDSIVPTFL